MKKWMISLWMGMFVLGAAAVGYASDATTDFSQGTKEAAIAYIESSMSDPQIGEWVIQKFHSKELFLMAVKLAPEKTVKNIAVSFSDFQNIGGGIKESGGMTIVVIAFILALVVFLGAVSSL